MNKQILGEQLTCIQPTSTQKHETWILQPYHCEITKDYRVHELRKRNTGMLLSSETLPQEEQLIFLLAITLKIQSQTRVSM